MHPPEATSHLFACRCGMAMTETHELPHWPIKFVFSSNPTVSIDSSGSCECLRLDRFGARTLCDLSWIGVVNEYPCPHAIPERIAPKGAERSTDSGN